MNTIEHYRNIHDTNLIEESDKITDTLLDTLLTEEVDDKTVAAAKSGGKRTAKNYIGQVIGWTSFFPISLLRSIYKIIRKKKQIKKLVKKEKDPEKKILLKQQLKGLSSKQVKIVKQIEIAKEKAKKKAKNSDVDRDKAGKSTEAFKKLAADIKAENEREK